jgi:hypothetical protein
MYVGIKKYESSKHAGHYFWRIVEHKYSREKRRTIGSKETYGSKTYSCMFLSYVQLATLPETIITVCSIH